MDKRAIIDKLNQDIAAAVAPPMEQKDALEILEELSADVDGQIDALKEDMKGAGEDEAEDE